MKYDDAKSTFLLEHCAERCAGYQKDDACENCEINAAIKAIDKQIPKPVTTKKLNEPVTIGRATFGKGTTILAMCPSCGGWVNRHHRYCPECGQAVYLEVEE